MPFFDHDGEEITAKEAAQANIFHASILAQDYVSEPWKGSEYVDLEEVTDEEAGEYDVAFWEEYRRLRSFFAPALDKLGVP
jgi:hypothetical protein